VWKELRSEELRSMCTSSDIDRIIKATRVKKILYVILNPVTLLQRLF
jgi:hypothetical protein